MKALHLLTKTNTIILLCVLLFSCHQNNEIDLVTPNISHFNSDKCTQDCYSAFLYDLKNDDDFKQYISNELYYKPLRAKPENIRELPKYLSAITKNNTSSINERIKEMNEKTGFINSSIYQERKNRVFKSLMTKYSHKYDLKILTDPKIFKEASQALYTKKTIINGGDVKVQKLPCDDIFLSYELMAQQDRTMTEWAFKTAVFVVGAYEAAPVILDWVES